VLWLFGDSFVASKRGQQRSDSRMIRNTLAIQTGYDPSGASRGSTGEHAMTSRNPSFKNKAKIGSGPGTG